MSLGHEQATISVLWQRDVKRFFRQPSRIIGALGQPIIFWLVIGSGMTATFALPNSPVDYMEYFFPGVVLMVVLFASIFTSMSVIDDRSAGFLQAVLAGPASRVSVVLGKCLGSASVAMVQAGLFLLLAPLAGFAYAQIDWVMLLLSLWTAALGVCAVGFAVAWWLNNVQAYHAVQMTLLIPLWIISGAMFPYDPEHAVFRFIMKLNPAAYATSSVRHAMYGGIAAPDMSLTQSPGGEFAVLLACGAVSLGVAGWVCRRFA